MAMKQPKLGVRRLTVPYVREGGKLRAASWDEALSRAAALLGQIREEVGGDALAVFSCSKSTNELNYLAQKFARVVLGTHNVDSCNRT